MGLMGVGSILAYTIYRKFHTPKQNATTSISLSKLKLFMIYCLMYNKISAFRITALRNIMSFGH